MSSPSSPTASLSWNSIFDNIESPHDYSDHESTATSIDLSAQPATFPDLKWDSNDSLLTDYFLNNNSSSITQNDDENDLFPFQPSPPISNQQLPLFSSPEFATNPFAQGSTPILPSNFSHSVQLDSLRQLGEMQQSYFSHLNRERERLGLGLHFQLDHQAIASASQPPPHIPAVAAHSDNNAAPLAANSSSAPSNGSLSSSSTKNKGTASKHSRLSSNKRGKKRTRSGSVANTQDGFDEDAEDMDIKLEREGGDDTLDADEEEKKKDALERNRIAASKSRQKKRQRVEDLETRATALTVSNHALQTTALSLLAEAKALRAQLSSLHTSCSCTHVVGYTTRETKGGGIPLIEKLSKGVIDDERIGEWDTKDGRVPPPSLGSEDDVVAVAWAKKLERESQKPATGSKSKATSAAGTRSQVHSQVPPVQGGAAAALRKPSLKAEALGLDLGEPAFLKEKENNDLLVEDSIMMTEVEKPDTKCGEIIPLRRRSSRVAASSVSVGGRK